MSLQSKVILCLAERAVEVQIDYPVLLFNFECLQRHIYGTTTYIVRELCHATLEKSKHAERYAGDIQSTYAFHL